MKIPYECILSKFLSGIIDVLLPIWLELINLSFTKGFIECLKSTFNLSTSKGLNSLLDPYKTVSTFQFIDKIIEQIVPDHLDEYA